MHWEPSELACKILNPGTKGLAEEMEGVYILMCILNLMCILMCNVMCNVYFNV